MIVIQSIESHLDQEKKSLPKLDTNDLEAVYGCFLYYKAVDI